MTIKSLATEITHFMNVELDDGTSCEYVRTPFGEWCVPVVYASYEDLSRVTGQLEADLEELFQTQ